MPRYPRLALFAVVALIPAAGFSHSTKEAIEAMTTAARAWTGALTVEQKKDAIFAFPDQERENWHYIPRTRLGVPFKAMTEPQRKLARALLESGLSAHGIAQADMVMSLEKVLHEIEHADHRDDTLYFFTVFGEPATTGTWGWRVEGHHLSLNFTIVDGQQIVATPNFVGANPAEVRLAGPQSGRRALAAEEDQGRALVLALDEAQRRRAIVAERAPGDILTRNDNIAKPQEPAGLDYASMTADQQQQLRALVTLYASRLRAEVADGELQKIADAGWNRLTFAWAGSIQPGQGHYYRIQSPDFIIEYDNTQNGANHIHTTWRVFHGDFGRDLLQEHYRDSHPAKSGNN
ncbi:MAG TPA: DUF3500 domain-containing protein [Lacunisphaera sp.]|nr:DUF3500 domain-containing protein [Lacunisphaera sp.]